MVDAFEDADGSSKKATLFDYDVQNANTVQLMLTPEVKDVKQEKKTEVDSATSSPIEKLATNDAVCKKNITDNVRGDFILNVSVFQKENLNSSSTTVTLEPVMSKFFKVAELVDAKNFEIQGAWVEAKIVGISRRISQSLLKSKGSPTKSAVNGEEKNVLSSINNPDSNMVVDDLVYTVEFEE